MGFKKLLLALLLSQQAFANSEISATKLEREIIESNYFSDGPATFASICQGEVCQSVAAGYARIDRKETVDQKNLVTVGSNSKYITAILILKLVDQGYLKLDDKLVDFFPEYSQWQGVTVRDLLNHSSGIPPYLFSKEGVDRVVKGVFNWNTRIWKPREIINLVVEKPSIFPSGSKVEYNNTNYVLLGMIAEKVTQKELGGLLSETIFRPLGMNDTYLDLRGKEAKRRVAGYTVSDLPLPGWFINLFSNKVKKIGPYLDATNIFDSSFVWAAGGMVSTTSDMAKLTKALFHGKLIGPELLDQMKKTRMGSVLGMPLEYGLGLMRMPSPIGDGYGHGGLVPGYQVVTNYFADHDLVFSISRNMGPSQLYSVYYDILDRLYKLDKQKPFVEDPSVNAVNLGETGVHFRLKGKVSAVAEADSFFSDTFGYAQVKEGGKSKLPFSGFHATTESKDGRSRIVLSAKAGKNFLAIGSKPEMTTPLLKVFINREQVLAASSSVFHSQASDVIFAIKGKLVQQADGSEKTCVSELIDTDRQASFQIEHNDGESFEKGESIKFSGNIPFKKVDPAQLPPELEAENLSVCP